MIDMGCEGHQCPGRSTCARYLERNESALVSRVLCRAGNYVWRIEVRI